MVLITIDLIRKRAEHNEGEIGTLEEISLHQEDIEKIEYIGQWCPYLKILLLQSNLISKIENLHKLKRLEYLNLAINSIERIENLEGCESLQKLDLTVNFIGDLNSVASLRNNHFLTELFLTGNPCTEYVGYRKFVIALLPQLRELDAQEITKSERIVALQEFNQLCHVIEDHELHHNATRKMQKERLKTWVKENEVLDKDDPNAAEKFWNSKSEYAPETRFISAKHKKRSTPTFGGIDKPKETPQPPVFFAKDGRPYNMNPGRMGFKFDSDDPEKYTLDLAVYKYLDTQLINVDIQPTYVRVSVKEKHFQLALPDEISTTSSTVVRSKANGHLVITMPLLHPNLNQKKRRNELDEIKNEKEKRDKTREQRMFDMDFSKIVARKQTFEDNSEVPPLI